uniref:Uncharacterized protein n=1 Tax=Rhizophora mucronata TaxID=61149 RepID=A0A2P2QU42_RHIMU
MTCEGLCPLHSHPNEY